MKTLYAFCLSIFMSLGTFSQNVITAEEIKLDSDFREQLLKRKRQQSSNPANNKAGICDDDTLVYSQYKSTSTRFINLNTSNSAHGFGQYFPVKDTVVIYGFNIYAYAQTTFGSDSGTANLYFANSQKVPGGVPILSIPININWNFTSPLSNIKQTVMFPTPYTAFFDFVVAIESQTTAGIAVATNNWDLGDGKMKGFACVKFPAGWARGTSVTVGSTTPPTVFDADIYLEPIVSYKVKSEFTADEVSCLGGGDPFKFKNTSSPILDEAYNPKILDGNNDKSFEWDYGDGSPVDSVIHGENNYLSSSITSYNVTLTSEFSGWTMPNSCKDTYVGLIKKPNLDAKFSSSINLGTVTITDQSVDATKWLWDFGDGTTDTLQSPVHTYASAGLYKIKLYASAGGCLDSAISTIQIESTGVNELSDLGIQLYPNPVKDQLQISLSKHYAATSGLYVELFSMTGSEVMSQRVANRSSNITLDMSSIRNGHYLLKMSDGRGNLIGRSVVIKD